MSQMIEVIYEDGVLKSTIPIKEMRSMQKALVIICPKTNDAGLDALVNTLSPAEAEEMQNLIDKEFSKIEGDW
mgnify:CR=1 FL=1